MDGVTQGLDRKNLMFAVFSAAYIAGIFLFAGSPAVSTLSAFNPCSLLHIPLYGVLTALLLFSIIPIRPQAMGAGVATGRMLIAGLIALSVGMADEYNQCFIPGREASLTDVFLDAGGTALTLLLFFRLYKKGK
jgi:hypothetical protein